MPGQKFSDKTREAVLRVAEELGYSPVSANPVYVDVDFQADQLIGKVTLWPRVGTSAVGGGSPDFPVNFTIQTATDNGNYSTVMNVINQPNPNGAAQTYTFAPVVARHLRVVATTLGTPASDEPSYYRL